MWRMEGVEVFDVSPQLFHGPSTECVTASYQYSVSILHQPETYLYTAQQICTRTVLDAYSRKYTLPSYVVNGRLVRIHSTILHMITRSTFNNITYHKLLQKYIFFERKLTNTVIRMWCVCVCISPTLVLCVYPPWQGWWTCRLHLHHRR